MRHTLDSLATFLSYSSPPECCSQWEKCCGDFGSGPSPAQTWTKAKPADLPRCLTNPENAASPMATLVRFGRDPDRTGKNLTGGGRKTWFPGPKGWYTIASILQDLTEEDEIPSGVYRVIFADPLENQVNRRPVDLTLEWKEESTEGQPAAEDQGPAPKQAHYDQLHGRVIDREKSLNSASEGHAQAARRAIKAGARGVSAAQKSVREDFQLVKEAQSVALGQLEMAGIATQAGHEALKKIATATVNATPPKPLIVEVIEAMTNSAERIGAKIIDGMVKRAMVTGAALPIAPEPAKAALPASEQEKPKIEDHSELLRKVRSLKNGKRRRD